MRAERLSKARKQLALLKSKFSLKMLKESKELKEQEVCYINFYAQYDSRVFINQLK